MHTAHSKNEPMVHKTSTHQNMHVLALRARGRARERQLTPGPGTGSVACSWRRWLGCAVKERGNVMTQWHGLAHGPKHDLSRRKCEGSEEADHGYMRLTASAEKLTAMVATWVSRSSKLSAEDMETEDGRWGSGGGQSAQRYDGQAARPCGWRWGDCSRVAASTNRRNPCRKRDSAHISR